jgi:hypothetical protein
MMIMCIARCFFSYDSVDRAVLSSVTHTINGVKVRLEKVKSSIVRAACKKNCVYQICIKRITGLKLVNF